MAAIKQHHATTNQKLVAVVEGMNNRRHGRGGACGRMTTHRLGRQMEQHKNKLKYMVALIGRQLANQHTTTNKKKEVKKEELLKRQCSQGEACRGVDSIASGVSDFDNL